MKHFCYCVCLNFIQYYYYSITSILFFYPCPLAAMIVAKMSFLQVMEYRNYIY